MKTSDIRISKDATNAEIASWARAQMARLGRPAPDFANDDNVIGMLVLYLVIDKKAALAYQVAEQSKIPRLAEAVRGAAARVGLSL